MEDAQRWFLRKCSGGRIFGPVSLWQLSQWCASAQVSPLDEVSADERVWVKAPMIPELEMDYLIELDSSQLYGPTTLGAVLEFLHMGEIYEETALTNCLDGSTMLIKDVPALQSSPHEPTPFVAEGLLRQFPQHQSGHFPAFYAAVWNHRHGTARVAADVAAIKGTIRRPKFPRSAKPVRGGTHDQILA